MYLLDTNVCIRFLQGYSPVVHRMSQRDAKEVVTCSVVKAELFYGAAKSNYPERNKQLQEKLIALWQSFPFDDKAADFYASLRANLEAKLFKGVSCQECTEGAKLQATIKVTESNKQQTVKAIGYAGC